MRFLLFMLACVCGFAQTDINPADLVNTYNILYPTQVSGLLVLFNANTGIYKDAGSTVAADGDTVQQWNDGSGNGYNATENTAARRPVYRANAINGFGAVDFGTKTSTDVTNRSIVSINPPFTVLVVYYSTNGLGIILQSDNIGVRYETAPGSFNLTLNGPDFCSASLQPTPGDWYCASGSTVLTGQDANDVKGWFGSYLCVDSKLKGRGNGLTVAMTFFRIGDFVDVSLKGMVAELMLYNRFLTKTERIGLELGLKKKYALQRPF